MIAKVVVYRCRKCDSQKIVKNGHNASGSQQYWCKDCGHRGVLEPKRGYTEATKRANPVSLLRTLQYAWHPAHFRCKSSDTGFLAKKRTRPAQNLKKHSCLPNLKMSWKPMKCGHSSKKDGTNVGCGQSCAAELAKSWRLCSGTEAR